MASHQISIRDDVYKKLLQIKQKHESYSDVISRLIGKENNLEEILKLAGSASDEEDGIALESYREAHEEVRRGLKRRKLWVGVSKIKLIFFDTSTIISLLHNKVDIQKIRQQISNEGFFAVTSISVYEIYFGIYQMEFRKKQQVSREKIKREKQAAQNFFGKLQVCHLRETDAIKAGKIFHQLKAKGKTIEQYDCLIAAIVINQKGEALITENVDHFSRIPQINLIDSKKWIL